jgi:hypothetical protein
MDMVSSFLYHLTGFLVFLSRFWKYYIDTTLIMIWDSDPLQMYVWTPPVVEPDTAVILWGDYWVLARGLGSGEQGSCWYQISKEQDENNFMSRCRRTHVSNLGPRKFFLYGPSYDSHLMMNDFGGFSICFPWVKFFHCVAPDKVVLLTLRDELFYIRLVFK